MTWLTRLRVRAIVSEKSTPYHIGRDLVRESLGDNGSLGRMKVGVRVI